MYTSHALSTAEYSVIILNTGYRKGYGVNYIALSVQIPKKAENFLIT
jgi:hypothetical protein